MFKGFKEGMRMAWIKKDLEEAIKAYGYQVVYYPSAEANRLAGIYPDVQDTIEMMKRQEADGMTIPNIRYVLIRKSLDQTVMAYLLLHEYTHVLIVDSDGVNPLKFGHTTAFFEAEEKTCKLLGISNKEGPEDYDENGKPIRGRGMFREGDI